MLPGYGAGAEIVAININDYVGMTELVCTPGAIAFTSTASFVANIQRVLGRRKMSLLHIQAHGDADGIEFGDAASDFMSVDNFDVFGRLHFAKLCGAFEKNAVVMLRACDVGMSVAVMRRFAALWRVWVVAGRGGENNVLDVNLGMYRVVSPDGAATLMPVLPPPLRHDVVRRAVREVTSRAAY